MDTKKIERTKSWLRYAKSFEKLTPRTILYVSLLLVLGLCFQFDLQYIGGITSFILLFYATTDLCVVVTWIVCSLILKKNDKEYYQKYIQDDDDIIFGRDTRVK